eukprot:SAG22_NODE_773_length_7297_cov_102.041539_2_plen_379_part_00
MSTADLRAFVDQENDDPHEYVKPLKEYLQTEGDIKGDLQATEEHLKKLKFTYVELLTKERFLGQVSETAGGQPDVSTARSNALDETKAKVKRSAKTALANLTQLQNQLSESAGPQLAHQWEALDAMRKKYLAELEWLDHCQAGGGASGAGGPIAHPAEMLAAKTKCVDQQCEIEQLKAEQAALSAAIAAKTADNGQLTASTEVLRADIAALEQRAGGQALRDGFAKDEMVRWYGATSAVLAALSGVQVQEWCDDILCFQLCSPYGAKAGAAAAAAATTTGLEHNGMDVDAGGESSLEQPPAAGASSGPMQTAQHTVTVTFDDSTVAAAGRRKIASIEVRPRDVQCDDVLQAAVEGCDLQLLVREVRSRITSTYSQRFG